MRLMTCSRLRYRESSFVKTVTFLIICSCFYFFFFAQNSKSKFKGQNLVKESVEENKEEENLAANFQNIFEKFEADDANGFKNLKEEQTTTSELYRNTETSKSQRNEPSWKFSRPPNIFDSENVGENGVPVVMPKILTPDVQEIVDNGWKQNQFNQYLSDLISLHRELPDNRGEYCKVMESNYRKILPPTSVIIIFHNEAWTTLLRSLHSVLDRSPEHLITEVLLVDDFSNLEHLKEPLDEYVSTLDKVRVLRAEQREGLIRARLRGAEAAKGPVLTFLDSHIECSPGWLEPLLDRIASDPTNVVVPVIEVIDDNTFAMSNSANPEFIQVGGFTWDLVYSWHTVPEHDRKKKINPWSPTRSPAMAGGLFSMDKNYFEKLGSYDSGMDIWGIENIEISVRIWTCGGSLEIIPCSKVGHIFRKKSPYTWRPGKNAVRINSIRMVEVWMDEYKIFFYARNGAIKEDYGDISDRVQLRKDLHCKSFQWYLDEVYPELKPSKDLVAFGEIRNLGMDQQRCLDANDENGSPVEIYHCHLLGGNQFWQFENGHFKRNKMSMQSDGDSMKVIPDVLNKREQAWVYVNETMQILHPLNKKCLTLTKESKVRLNSCDIFDSRQKWKFEHFI